MASQPIQIDYENLSYSASDKDDDNQWEIRRHAQYMERYAKNLEARKMYENEPVEVINETTKIITNVNPKTVPRDKYYEHNYGGGLYKYQDMDGNAWKSYKTTRPTVKSPKQMETDEYIKESRIGAGGGSASGVNGNGAVTNIGGSGGGPNVMQGASGSTGNGALVNPMVYQTRYHSKSPLTSNSHCEEEKPATEDKHMEIGQASICKKLLMDNNNQPNKMFLPSKTSNKTEMERMKGYQDKTKSGLGFNPTRYLYRNDIVDHGGEPHLENIQDPKRTVEEAITLEQSKSLIMKLIDQELERIKMSNQKSSMPKVLPKMPDDCDIEDSAKTCKELRQISIKKIDAELRKLRMLDEFEN